MPVQQVDIPGVGTVEFPDSMTSDQINVAAKRLHDEANAPKDQGFMQGVLNTLPTPSKIMGMIRSVPENIRQRFAPGADPAFPNQDTTNTPIGKVMGGRPYEGAGEMLGIGGQLALGEAVPRVVSARMRPPEPPPPHLDLSTPIKAGDLTPQQMSERIAAADAAKAAGQAPPPAVNRGPGGRPVKAPKARTGPVEATAAPEAAAPPMQAEPPPPAAQTKSPQQLLNEEAIARRRAAYQARQQAPVETPVDPAQQFNERFGLKTPTPEETRFPKGMRGGPRSSEAGNISPELLKALGIPWEVLKYPAALHYGGWPGVAGTGAIDLARVAAKHPQGAAQTLRASLLANLAASQDPKTLGQQ